MEDLRYDILRHALAWPKCYRNRYVTGKGSDDHADCEALTNAGFMECHKVCWIPDNTYTVTDSGKAKLRELDLEKHKRDREGI